MAADVSTKHPDYGKFERIWRKVRDCVAGAEAVKLGRERYLPTLWKQEADEYRNYLTRAVFFEATKRTLKAFEGFVFRKNPDFKLGNLATVIAPFMKDATMTGVSFYDYCKQIVHDVFSIGRSGTLIDWDSPADENRPFLVRYDTEDIINWKYGRVKGQTVLTLLVLYEAVKDDPKSGETEFEHVTIDQWRVYELQRDGAGNAFVLVTIWRRINAGSGAAASMQMTKMNEYTPNRKGLPLQRIPFVFHNVSGDTAELHEVPMEGMAELNLAHYRTSADLENARHMAGSPTPYAVGFAKDNDWILGSTKAWVSDNAQAKCGFLELNGTSLATLDKGIDDKERQMAALGARMLETQNARREAFETVQIRQSGDVGALSELTIMCTQTLSKVLCWVAWWLTVEPTPESMSDKIHVELNSDFVSARLDAPTLTLVLQAFLSTPPAISYHTFFNIMQKGEIIDAEITEPQELAAIQQIIAERAKWAKEAPPGPPAPPPGPPAPGGKDKPPPPGKGQRPPLPA